MAILIPPPKEVNVIVEAELHTTATLIQLAHYCFAAPPPDMLMREEDMVRMELCLTSRHRTACASFPDYWSSHRFERLGDIFVATPKTDLLIRTTETAPQTSILCMINPESMRPLLDIETNWTDRRRVSSLDIRSGPIRTLLVRLADELRHPGFAGEMLVDLVAGQITIELVRHYCTIDQSPARGGLAPWQFRRIDDRLRELCKAPTLQELAALCRLSVRQLTRGFRASHGSSIGDYVIKSQIDHAKRLLATDASIASIGNSLGFSCSSNFCYAFRRAIGLTPGQYRQHLLRN